MIIYRTTNPWPNVSSSSVQYSTTWYCVLEGVCRTKHVLRIYVCTHAACSMLNVKCCTLNVACSMLNVACSMLNVACSMLNAACSMLNAACYMLNAAC